MGLRGAALAERLTALRGVADAKLVAGSVLFGIGWGTAGSCPGPLVVVVGAAPLAPGTLLYTAALALGMRVAAPLWRLMAAPPATQRRYGLPSSYALGWP